MTRMLVGLTAMAVLAWSTAALAAGDFNIPAGSAIPIAGANASVHNIDRSSGTADKPNTKVTRTHATASFGKGHAVKFPLLFTEAPSTITVTMELFGGGTANQGCAKVVAGCCGTTTSAVECIDVAMGAATYAPWTDQAAGNSTKKFAISGIALQGSAAGATCYAVIFPNVDKTGSGGACTGTQLATTVPIDTLSDEVSW